MISRDIADPVLRSFRVPVHIRLRQKVDDLNDRLAQQSKTIAEQGQEIASLNKRLRFAEREAAELRAYAESVVPDEGGGDAVASAQTA